MRRRAWRKSRPGVMKFRWSRCRVFGGICGAVGALQPPCLPGLGWGRVEPSVRKLLLGQDIILQNLMILAHHPFVKALAKALRHQCRVAGASRLLVATSGGPDSVALLRALAAIAPRRQWNLKLHVGHIQHHLRQGAAESDARFVEHLSDELGLPFERSDLDLAGASGAANLEARAREARYRSLREMARRLSAQSVVTGHHGDDQLETMLMRWLRGSSVRGLRGMPWRRRIAPASDIWLLRPMLALDRQAVMALLDDLNQPWCEDQTNADLTRLRARLREQVVPVLRSIRPDVARRSVSLSQHLRGVVRLLDEQAKEAAGRSTSQTSPDCTVIDRVSARQMAPVVLNQVVRTVLTRAGAKRDSLGRRAVDPMLRAIRDSKGGRRRFAFGGGVVVTVTAAEVEVRRARSEGCSAKGA